MTFTTCTGTYAQVTDVSRHLPGRNFLEVRVAGRTVVTDEDVCAYLSEVSDEMDGVLRRLDFTVPIVNADSPISFAQLRDINAIGAAALVEEAYASARGQESGRAKELQSLYQYRMDRIVAHGALLLDAVGGTQKADSIADSGMMTDDYFFAVDMKW